MAHNKKKPAPSNSTMSLGDHLEDLRHRVILALAGVVVAMVLCLIIGKYIIAFVEKPYVIAMGEEARLQSLAPADGFTSFMNLSMIASVVISSPWIFYQLWMFISAGLYPHEKRYVYMAVPFSAALFIIGALFFVFVIAPLTIRFLVMFNKDVLGVASNFTFKDYISFINIMMLIFGLAFQTPIAIFFLIRMGLISIKTFNKSRPFVIFGVVVVSAFATPGDMISLFTLSIALYLLFELGIILGYFANRKQNIIQADTNN